MPIELSLLGRVDGSCSIQSPEVDIITSVAGPMEAKPRQELPQQVALEILITPPIGPTSTKEKLLEDDLKKILNRVINIYQYPRQMVQVVSQVLKNNDSVAIRQMKYIVNSTYLALIDSGVSLNSSFLAASCILTVSDEFKFEFSNEEFLSSKASFLIVYGLKNGVCDELILFKSNGDNLTQDLIKQVLDASRVEIASLNQKIRKVIEGKLQKDYIWKF